MRPFEASSCQCKILVSRPSSTRSSRNRFTPFTLWCGDSWTCRHAKHRYTEKFTIWRPLLALSRQQIELWAAEMQLKYSRPKTNFDTSYDRAWCRAGWPILEKRFPKMQQLWHTSYLMQDAEMILADVLAQDWASCGNTSV